jgi:hypothetical protein
MVTFSTFLCPPAGLPHHRSRAQRIPRCFLESQTNPIISTSGEQHEMDDRLSPCLSLRIRVKDFVYKGGLRLAYNSAPSGTFGRVICCINKHTGRRVALKIIPVHAATRAVFLNEAEILMRIHTRTAVVHAIASCGHPVSVADRGASNVTQVIGSGEEPNLNALDPSLPRCAAYLLAFEVYVDTLHDHAGLYSGRQLPMHVIMRAACDVARGLAFLSKQNIVVRSA